MFNIDCQSQRGILFVYWHTAPNTEVSRRRFYWVSHGQHPGTEQVLIKTEYWAKSNEDDTRVYVEVCFWNGLCRNFTCIHFLKLTIYDQVMIWINETPSLGSGSVISHTDRLTGKREGRDGNNKQICSFTNVSFVWFWQHNRYCLNPWSSHCSPLTAVPSLWSPHCSPLTSVHSPARKHPLIPTDRTFSHRQTQTSSDSYRQDLKAPCPPEKKYFFNSSSVNHI